MSKTRIIDLAQELGTTPDELSRKLEDMGIRLPSPTATLSDEELEAIREKLAAPKKARASEERRVRSTVIRRRFRKKDRAGAEPEPEAAVAAPVEEPKPAPEPEVVEAAKETKPAAKEENFPKFTSEEEFESKLQPAPAPAPEPEEPPEPVEEEPVEEPVEETVEAEPEPVVAVPEIEEPVEAAEKPGKKLTSDDLMPKTFSMEELIPGYAEMEEENKQKAAERAKAEKERSEKAAAEPEGKVPNQDLEAFKEAFEKARKKKGGARKTSFDRNQELKLRRGVVVEDFGLRGPRKRRKSKKDTHTPQPQPSLTKAAKRVVKVSGDITVSMLASELSVKASALIVQLMGQGMMVGVNDVLDSDTIELIADDFGFTVEDVQFDLANYLPKVDESTLESQPRPPVITIMGHVDHGKTSLLDRIRNEKRNIVDQEAGGITQHIGAYVVETESGQGLVFLDTPGHEAFTAMRARGAQVTDLVVLVVAADDGAKPQTIEAINHAKAAEVPLVVAVNKIDKAEAKPERVRQELTEHGIVPEQWGGDTSFVDISAMTGQGVDDLLEILALQAEMLELSATPDRAAIGTVVESRLDRGLGPVATVIVGEGTLKKGDVIVSGAAHGNVRTLRGDLGDELQQVQPGHPAVVVGWNAVPTAGEMFYVVEDERSARTIRDHFEQTQKTQKKSSAVAAGMSMEELSAMFMAGDLLELNLVLKADVQGSVEAIRDSIMKIESSKVKSNIMHSAVGGITESDIQLAAVSGGLVIGFNVRADLKARQLAEQKGVTIKTYTIIYELLDEVKATLLGMLAPTRSEKLIGTATVRDTFQIKKIGVVAGLNVNQGKLVRGCAIRLFRDDVKIYEGKLQSLKRFKDDVREVTHGYECGTSFEEFQDVRVDDVVEAYEITETAAVSLA